MHSAARWKADKWLVAALGQVYRPRGGGEWVAHGDGQDKALLGKPLDAVPGPQAGVFWPDHDIEGAGV
jgi:hypothetical protein